MKKSFNIASIVAHGACLFVFILVVSCSVLYHFFWDTEYWRIFADAGFWICFVSLLGLMVTISFSLSMNVLSAVFSKRKTERIAWIIFSVVSPFVLVFINMIQCAVIVGETGGV